MKRISKINDNEYISKEVEQCSTPLTIIIEGVIYLSLLGILVKFINKWL